MKPAANRHFSLRFAWNDRLVAVERRHWHRKIDRNELHRVAWRLFAAIAIDEVSDHHQCAIISTLKKLLIYINDHFIVQSINLENVNIRFVTVARCTQSIDRDQFDFVVVSFVECPNPALYQQCTAPSIMMNQYDLHAFRMDVDTILTLTTTTIVRALVTLHRLHVLRRALTTSSDSPVCKSINLRARYTIINKSNSVVPVRCALVRRSISLLHR